MPALEKNHIYRSTIEGYSSEGLGVAASTGRWCSSTTPSGARTATFW